LGDQPSLHLQSRTTTPSTKSLPRSGVTAFARQMRGRPTRSSCRSDRAHDQRMITKGGHVTARPILQAVRVGVLEPGPDLRLPGALFRLHRRLEARLARRDEHRDHPEAQAQPADPADCHADLTGTLCWALKNPK